MESTLFKLFPSSAFDQLPVAEREEGQISREHLQRLPMHIERINHAIALFAFSEQQTVLIRQQIENFREKSRGARERKDWAALKNSEKESDAARESLAICGTWMQIVARDVAITIYDFHRSVVLAKVRWERLPVLNARANNKAVGEAMTLYAAHFPNADLIRNATGHSVDFLGTKNNAKNNSVRGSAKIPKSLKMEGGAVLGLASVIQNRTVTFTGYGEVLSFDLTSETVARLREITEKLYRAFIPGSVDDQ